MSLGQMLEESCGRFPDRVACIQEDRRLTYRDLDRAVNSLGNHLRDRGVHKGDRIGLMLPNCPEFVIAYFALQKIGAVAVTLNVLSTSYELRHLLADSEATGLITTTLLAKKFEDTQDDLPLCRLLLLHNEEQGVSPFWEASTAGPFTLEMPPLERDDPAVMIYTAGLTGRPLGAVLTQGNLLTQAELLKVLCGTTEQDKGLALIPFFHSFGAVVNMLCVVRVGASVVLMDHFSLKSIFSALEEEAITFIAAVPQLFIAMVMEEGEARHSFPSLALCISGGSAMPPEFFPRFEETFGVKIMEGYGLTEASPVCAFTRPSLAHKPGSVGTPVPGVEARVVDEEHRVVPTGETGELLIRGYNVMKGYYKDEETTRNVIRDGWLYTGDLANIDEDGYIFLTGLKKRMIISSGFNVYPREVEVILNLHPAVEDSLAVGRADTLRGEVVKAFVVKSPEIPVTERELVRHCRNYLSSYKVPRKIEFVERLEKKTDKS